MAAVVIRGNARVTWLTGLASLRAKARDMARRATAYAAAAVMGCAVGAALLQLAAQILSFSAPIAVTGLTVMAAALLTSLRRHLRTQARLRYGPANPRRVQRLARQDLPAYLAQARLAEHGRPAPCHKCGRRAALPVPATRASGGPAFR